VTFDLPIGVFEGQSDVGGPLVPGSASYDASSKQYTINSAGYNIWYQRDEFRFLWKKMSGDVSLAADITFPGGPAYNDRKVVLIFRQDLDDDSKEVMVGLHRAGLIHLVKRLEKNTKLETVHRFDAPERPAGAVPIRLGIEKRGDTFTLLASLNGEVMHSVGTTADLHLGGPFYVGIGYCSHRPVISDTALVSNVTLEPITTTADTSRLKVESLLETIDITSAERTVIHRTREKIEAPNWSRDGHWFFFNSKGRILKLPVTGGTPQVLDTGTAVKCNNDHGLSPDGTLLVVTDRSVEKNPRVYIVPVEGGAVREITRLAPSYWHGWSPDGKMLTYTAERNGNGNFDIYTIPVAGGIETRLTTNTGLDDGPEYSADGHFIYFNSERHGMMQIWRMKLDGSEQEPVVADEYQNWFPHPSPDGKWIVFVSFPKEVPANLHPANKDVMLRIMPAGGGPIRILTKLFGGQGTINVPSWSPDSHRVAFVSYRLVEP
jgi:TolB protein